MTIFYNLNEDGTVYLSTPFARVAKNLSLTLQTEEEIVLASDGRRYLKSMAPIEEDISDTEA